MREACERLHHAAHDRWQALAAARIAIVQPAASTAAWSAPNAPTDDPMRTTLTLAILAALAPAAHAVEIDGVIGEGEWAQARHVTDFRLTQPLSRAPAPQPTQAWVQSTPDGLAVAFRMEQAASIPRTRERSQRDDNGPVDRVNVYVDFDGDGRTGYNFTVTLGAGISDSTITSENQFNDDWDGNWQHAVSEDAAGWTAEILVPWHIAPMQDARGDTRTIGLQLDRVIGATGERMSWPAVSYTEPTYLTRFEKVPVAAYSQSLLAITPYASAVRDEVGEANDLDAGLDLFWKPSGRFQLSGTLNPDFGQVESDELTVNFSATESFFSDKRPFFTENQSYFDVPFGSLNNANRLLYTRRVGAQRDDGDGSGDVLAAAKVNGSVGALNYGLFAATEGEDVGRDFYALRATRDFATQGIGAMLTRVERPFLDRTATVAEVDHRWNPSEALTVRTVAVGSQVEQAGGTLRDSGAQVKIDHVIGGGWQQQLYLLHLGRDLELNDFGYLERDDFNYGRYELRKRITALPEASAYRSVDYRGAVSHRSNDRGLHIADAWAFNRQAERKDGGNEFAEIAGWTAGHDDRILRGNGEVRMPAKLFAFYERFRPRQGESPWAVYGNVRYAAEGLGGPTDGAVSTYLETSYKINDRLSWFASLELNHNPDWLLWRGGNLLGTFEANTLEIGAGMTWLIDPRQELRVRLESIGLDADARQAWRVGADRRARKVDEPLADFGLNALGFQVRYRYELAPLSYLYIAYVRGGDAFGEREGLSATDEFTDAFSLRNSEQFLLKLSYRFEL